MSYHYQPMANKALVPTTGAALSSVLCVVRPPSRFHAHPRPSGRHSKAVLVIWINPAYICGMATLAELEDQALSLPDDQRAVLAAHLLDSLPAILHDDDAGITEAARRDAELDGDPSAGMTLGAFKAAFGH